MTDYSNRAVSRALSVMDVLNSASRSMLLTEIALAADLDRATTYRLLHVLAAHGYAHRDETSKRYSAKFKLNAHTKRELPDLAARVVRPLLQELHAETGAAVSMASLLGSEISYYQEYLGRDQLQTQAELFRGKRLPSHATACGKVLLAEQPEAEFDRIYEYVPLYRYTPRTIRTMTDLRETLGGVRDNGYATNEGELEFGRLCVAVSLRIPNGMKALSLSLSLPAGQAERLSIGGLVDRLRATGERISAVLESSGGLLS
jgi:DNA-binding IclR family transcriptional regulator